MSTREIIREIAKQNGVTPRQVKADMREAMRVSMQSDKPAAREFWKRLSPDGREPSIGDFIKACAGQINL